LALTRTSLTVDKFLIEDLVAEVDALVADVNARTSNQLADLFLRFTAERTLQVGVKFRHCRRARTSVSRIGSKWPRVTPN
jgi:hypothetical protein